LSGFLEHFLDVPVNRISAPHLATDRGITLRELTTKDGAHASTISLRIKDASGVETCAAGALGSDGSPRLVRWRDFNIEARLEGTALVVESLDKPGVIGFLGTTLGDGQINVAAVHLGKSSAGNALSVWNLDDAISDELVAHIQSSPNVMSARLIRL
jgi:D-3-phosphoglycerate dehydrogenase